MLINNPRGHHFNNNDPLLKLFGIANSQKDRILSEDIEGYPFEEYIYWSRRIVTEQTDIDCPYTTKLFEEETGANRNDLGLNEYHNQFLKWRSEQPKVETETPFGKAVREWGELAEVETSLTTASRLYAWKIVRENQRLIENIRNGKHFLVENWAELILLRNIQQTLDGAMYRLHYHCAGFWDYDHDLASADHWLDALWVVCLKNNINPLSEIQSNSNSSWLKQRVNVQSSNPRCWWFRPIDKEFPPNTLIVDEDDLEEDLTNKIWSPKIISEFEDLVS